MWQSVYPTTCIRSGAEMSGFIIDWVHLLARWAHFVTGIAWIGSSLYFVWLDNHLQTPRDRTDVEKGVGGEVWSVHGGGFYHAQKYTVSPRELPATLHWFKWEAYSTWLTGMFLLGVVYFLGAEVYLIDRSVAELSALQAIAIACAFIVGGWLIYDGLCRTALANSDGGFALLLLVLIAALAWSLCQLFSGRAAYILFGAVLGTIMVANVFFVIIPGQKLMVAAAERGEVPDPAPGLRAKTRSVHNTYFTLPVLFAMISNHFAMTYGHAGNWLILVAISVAGALIRVWFVARHKGKAPPLPIVAALLVLLVTAAAMAPRAPAAGARVVTTAEITPIVIARCANCHSATPTFPAYPVAPLGVVLDNEQQILAEADRVFQQTVVTRVMPIGNLTGMTDEERQLLADWYAGLRRQ